MSNNCILSNYSSKSHNGYPLRYVNRKPVRESRLVYCLVNNLKLQDIADKVVRHSCDNPKCVNPKHLVLGTQLENMEDRKLRGRNELCGRSGMRVNLSDEEIAAIRLSLAPHRSIAAQYGVAIGTVGAIKRSTGAFSAK